MNDIAELSIVELGAVICESLVKEGVRATLSGGACAQIYSNQKYVTGDLDFVVNFMWPENAARIKKVMSDLGFEKTGRIYVHQAVSYSVEFPPGPLSIGEEYRIQPVELKCKTGTLALLSPTDSVKDRLTGYFYGNDLQCLEQAIMIFAMNDVKIADIRSWAKNEGNPERYKEFEKRVSKRKRNSIKNPKKGDKPGPYRCEADEP